MDENKKQPEKQAEQKPAVVQVDTATLKDLLVTVMEEARKPVITDEMKRKQAADAEARKSNAALVLAEEEKKRNFQRLCSHMRRDGSTRAVYVVNGNFMICQACQAVVRPGVRPDNYNGRDIYDNDLFNKLFQLSQPAIFG